MAAASWPWNMFSGDQKNASNLPPVTALQEQRSKQITSLRNLNPNVVELKVQMEYRITFSQQGQNIALDISLPPQFPQVKPTVRVSPPCRHPWIGPNMEVIGCQRLCSFGVHTDLGKVMQDIVQEFTQNPPVIFTQSHQPPVPSYQPYSNGVPGGMNITQGNPPPPPSYAPMPAPNPPGPGTFRPQWPPMPMPPLGEPPVGSAPVSIGHIDFPKTVDGHMEVDSNTLDDSECNFNIKPNTPPPLLQGPSYCYQLPEDNYRFLERLSQEDLQELLDDEQKFTELYNRMPGPKRIFTDRSQLYHQCQQLSKENLSSKSALTERTARLRALQQDQLELSGSFQRNSARQETLNRHCSPQNLLDNIRVVAADAEHSSDKLAEDFVEGKLPLEEFMRQYTDERRKFHLRKVKEEKLTQMINNRTHLQ